MKILEKYRFLADDLVTRREPAAPVDQSIREAIAWICRAQDSSDDRGVSHSYTLGRGWAPSYPETTGYIIPTLLNWSRLTNDSEARRRALEMADWESQIQLPDGGVMASVVNRSSGKPVVFNTGQVIFGWLAAYRESGNDSFLTSASRAAHWLRHLLGTSETWLTHGSMGEDHVHTYNVRVAWALLELGKITGDDSYHEPVQRMIEWVLGQEETPGWFGDNCLSDNRRPLLHTIGYTARGLLEAGILLNKDRYVEAATRTADALIAKMRPDGFLAGRFDNQWNAVVKWSCLTGMAQISIVLSVLFDLTQNEKYRDSARALNRFLQARQRIRAAVPGVRGGIAGSFPVNAEYQRYRMLNWATKFFVDALLHERYPALRNSGKYYAG